MTGIYWETDIPRIKQASLQLVKNRNGANHLNERQKMTPTAIEKRVAQTDMWWGRSLRHRVVATPAKGVTAEDPL